MTTGERLVDISTLSTGTALDHFLNISVGAGEVIYTCLPIEVSVNPVEKLTIKVAEMEELKVISTFIPQPVIVVSEPEQPVVVVESDEPVIVET